MEQFPCLGLSILGACSYNPTQPASIYFGIGEAIAALGFTLAIQQFLKPIYQFRLRAYGLKLWYIFLGIFLGFISAVIAAFLPNLPIAHNSFFSYPVVWELLGAILIGAVYGVTAFISLTPARTYNWNLLPFARAAGHLLSKADDSDRVSFAEDLFHNFPLLIKNASAWSVAKRSASNVEFERLRAIGAPLVISGTLPISAFYEFSHRRELERASYAGTLLAIIADPPFCAALVHKCPWLTASMLRDISEKHLHADQAERFIQEIARQAIINEESLMAREVDYSGFGSVPLLSESLFGNWFILTRYNPLQQLQFDDLKEPSEGYIVRLNGASKMILETAIEAQDYWPQGYMHGVEKVYENLFHQLSFKRYEGLSITFQIKLHRGVADLYKLTTSGLKSLEQNGRSSLFIRGECVHNYHLVHSVASIVYESLASIANSFSGYDDKNWHYAISTFNDIYPSHSHLPGMDPLQQQLAVQLIDKLKNNMEGYYPAISRLILAVVGPYDDHTQGMTRTARRIFKDAVYKTFQKLPELHARKPEKISDFLPANVTYDSATNTLHHIFSDGNTRTTNLSTLVIPEINLFDESNWRI